MTKMYLSKQTSIFWGDPDFQVEDFSLGVLLSNRGGCGYCYITLGVTIPNPF